MTPAEKGVLLAAAASPLLAANGRWHRADLPARRPLNSSELQAFRRLRRRGSLYWSDRLSEAWPTDAGLGEARRIRRQLPGLGVLRALGDAGELVRRERETTQAEAAAILATDGVPADRVVEWVRPLTGAEWSREREPVAVCSGVEMDAFRQLGLVVLLAGDTRAQLTGAGRWCAGLGPESDSNGSGAGEATGGGQRPETASGVPQRPSKEVLR